MFKIANGYSDFCVPYNDNQSVVVDILKELIEVGFKNVAIEQTYKHENVNMKSGADPIPQPVKLDELNVLTNKKLNLYNRLTIIYSDPSISHVIGRSQNFKKYQIIAALPISESALQHACQTFQGDIITYDADTIRVRLSRKFYYLAIRRNMFLEIKYSPCIVDSNDRRATITRAQQYHMIGKSKAIIISSAATDSFHIRSPYDIASLGLIFGLSEEEAKCAISTMGRKLLVAAESRRLGRTPVVMKYADVDTSTSEEEEDEDMEAESSSSLDSKKRKVDSLVKNGGNKKQKKS